MSRLKEAYKDAYNNKTSSSEIDARMLLAVEELEPGTKVLEVGLGSGGFSKGISSFIDIDLYGVDVSQSAIDSCKDYLVEGFVRDLSNENLPWQNNYFHSVICLEVFEHLQNPYKALSEIQRVLMPGGKLILSLPNSIGGHLMIYPGLERPKNFRLFLRQNYFYVRKIKPFGVLWHMDNIGQLISQRFKNPFMGKVAAFIAEKSLMLNTNYYFICND